MAELDVEMQGINMRRRGDDVSRLRFDLEWTVKEL